MAQQAQCHRVRSALTQKVNVIEDGKAGFHAGLPKYSSGQLPFLAFKPWPMVRRCWQRCNRFLLAIKKIAARARIYWATGRFD
jgi:hypothetical protein